MPENHFSSELHFTVGMVDSIKKKKSRDLFKTKPKSLAEAQLLCPSNQNLPEIFLTLSRW